MGVISEARQRTPGNGPNESDGTGQDAPDVVPEDVAGPFEQNYSTEKFQADHETINEMLTGAIAVANLL